ncbi:MAG TPA: enoyl-CoA hydratase [Hyphomonadaceae bacterium]|jgi:enoyl-CoA hydratase|nr:enoyl-CoA hydratase [Hyphomonadaceae bacterium]
MSDEQLLLVERDGPVAVMTMNRPKQLNALSIALRKEMVRTIRELGRTEDVRAVVVTGSGRAFSAGVDLKEAGQSGFVLGAGGFSDGGDMDLARAFGACPWPIIGAINGFAITGGFEVALMCDVLIASSEAKFADTHGRVGLMPVWGLSQKLPRLIGAARAKELSLTGNFLDAPTAERWGLVNRVVAPEELLSTAKKLGHEMAQVDGALLRRIKSVIDDGMQLPLEKALELEIVRGNEHNSTISADFAEKSRGAVMARGREQTS